MSTVMPVGAGDLLRHKSFLLFLLSRSFSRFATQIGAVAIGWQVYELTGSAWKARMKSAPGTFRSNGSVPPPI